jgi:hypothetical protein
VDIDEEVGHAEGTVEDEQQSVGLRTGEAEGGGESHEAVVPSTWGLLQAIESTVEAAHVITMCRVNEPGGLLIEHHLRELHMKERVLDVDLPYLLVAGERDREDDPDGGGFNNRAKGLIEVDAMFLRETAQDPTGFIAVKRTIRLELLLKNPFADDDVGIGGGITRVPVSLATRAPYSSVMAAS